MFYSQTSRWTRPTIALVGLGLALSTWSAEAAEEAPAEPTTAQAPDLAPAPAGGNSTRSMSGVIKLGNADVKVALQIYRVITQTELVVAPGAQLDGVRVSIDSKTSLPGAEAAALIERELKRQCGLQLTRLDGNRISVGPADPKDVPVVPRKEVTISVQGLDDETGAPLSTYQVYWIEKPGTFRHLGQGRDGAFEYTTQLAESAEYTLEIRAEGYMPQTTPTRKASDEPTPLEVRLHRADTIEGQVFSPDGKPAAGANVFLAGKNFGPRMAFNRERPEGFLTNPRQDPDKQTPADADGRFSLPPAPGAEYVVIQHDTGCAAVPLEEVARGMVLLQPWARLEGVLQVTPAPDATPTVSLTYRDRTGATPRVPYNGNATPRADGSFVFAQVPPGEFTLSRMEPVQSGGASMRKATHSLPVTLHPAETNYVTLDDAAAIPVRE